MSTISSPSPTTETRQPAKSRQGILGGVLISFITLVVLLGGVELAGYIWERKTAQGELGWTLVASRRLELELHGEPERPYYLFRPHQGYLWENIPVHINSRGLRTEEVAWPKPAGVYRLLTVGDSVTFGWRVQQEETYGKQLEQLLTGRVEGQQVEVVNAGVPGWTLEATRNFLLDQGFDYQPDAIVLSVTVVNDITIAPVISEENALFNWLRDNTYGWPFLTTQLRFLLARRVGPEAIPELNPPQEARRYYPLREENPVYDQVWSYVAEMAAASEARNIPFLVVVFPTAFQVNSAAHPDVPQRVFSQRAAAEGVTMVDMLPVFQQACAEADAGAEAGAGACEGYENALFADVWMHPNAAGHRLAAEQIMALWPFH
ncbi:MAG: GDSL-type esterase/lipase family protein [Chloroflexi bacterium]|nr:GDSL-type esterase/lipase family protein [Chloroflexota bacterium]MCI0574994.1 GDSL-type esterase/lipase family protein [Chloroflexota bacterium]MCI0645778.1 GDSL-type esterase/lipase family protein [Chloroflexota bacterium]MCI0727705.1 GDSL-type esterase/lipase family protein [Chloroflexota bacterium]